LYTVVGCYFETWTDSYGNTAQPKRTGFGGVQASVPTMFYTLLLRTKKGNTEKSVMECSREELQCVAFVMSHAMQKEHEPERRDMRSVAEIERLTGFTFFANVPNAPKDTYNPSDWGL
ncbi:MAG TPA: endonuclease, partial [Alistipes sp.]|nr:endonuclease [Alistipes sp.]